MRTVLRPLAVYSAHSPIEIIVFFSIVGTLAYFHILSAIKHSAFFAPTYPSTLRPAYALQRDGEWVGVGADYWNVHGGARVEVQQVVLTLDSVKSKPVSFNDCAISRFCHLHAPRLLPLILSPPPTP